MSRSRVVAASMLLALAGCKHDAEVRGSVTQAGHGVPGVKVTLDCPDGSKRTTSTTAGGEFRFDDVGPGVDDRCEMLVDAPGGWVAPQSVASRCGQHDPGASGLCTQVRFAFEVR